MIKRRAFHCTLALLLLAAPLAAGAQHAGRVPQVGFLAVGTLSVPNRCLEGFRRGLAEIGYAEGKNIALEMRSAEAKPERLSELAADLVRLKVDVIFAPGTLAAQSVMQVKGTPPIVFASAADPIGSGLIKGFGRPGGNLTGLSLVVGPEIAGKYLELLREAVPRVSRIAVIMLADPVSQSRRVEIAALASKHRFPSMYGLTEHVEAGGLMAYGVDLRDNCRRAATYVNKILKGAKPADLPVEQPTKFELVINLKTAKALGLTIPPSLLGRADEVIQ